MVNVEEYVKCLRHKPGVDALRVMIILNLKFLSHCNNSLHSLLVSIDVCDYGFMLLRRRFDGGKIVSEIVLSNQPLILTQPCFSHACFTIESCSKLFEFFLSVIVKVLKCISGK